MSRNTILLILLGLIFLCCCFCAIAGATAFFIWQELPSIEPVGTPASRLPTPQPRMATPTPPTLATPTPRLQITPAPRSGPTTEQLLLEMEVPAADPRDLAARFKPDLGEIPLVVNATSPDYAVNDRLIFWVSNTETDENFRIEAVLRHKSAHLYMWVEEGEDVDMPALRRSAQLFDERIYPTNREFFGSEWTPGIDNDVRLHVLHATGLGGTVAGYYSSADEVSNLVNPYSNEKEMFYINLGNTRPGSSFYDAVLAHEFQHMIHWYQDQNESTWLNEGAAELATQLNGLGRSENNLRPDQVFAGNPDLQLNTWPDNDESYAHYGNSYLFLAYFLSRFGEEATKALVAHERNGMESVDAALTNLGIGLSADDLFSDWVIANWLDDPDQGDGRWGYPDFEVDDMAVSTRHRRLPAEGEGDVRQYAADYIRVSASGDVEISFEGDPYTRLVATAPYSGQWVWWGNRVDESDTRLTLAADLSQVDAATLRFRTWYDIEELWDYAYVVVSADEGRTWIPLETGRTTRENPQGTAYGPGYTGVSNASGPGWVLEEVDLSPFAGQPLQIRFEYITDAAVTRPGMFIDDVEIPEIGYFNDFETGPGDWQSEGWLLTDNVLAQRWRVQVIETGRNGAVQVHRLPVAADGRGVLQLQNVDSREDLILVISALAPVTEEIAGYTYSIRAVR